MNPFGYFRAAVVCALVATSTYRWHAANTALARSSESRVSKKGTSKGMANIKGKGKDKGSIRNSGKGHKGNQVVPPWRRN